jgi:small GTP-binding protein
MKPINRNYNKIVIAGDGGTGKSTLISSKLLGRFDDGSKITIGVDFATLNHKVDDGSTATFLIFDLGGQKRFHFIHNSYVLGAKGAILLYDLTRNTSFENIPKWLNLLTKDTPNIPIILVGSKKDLAQPEDINYYTSTWEQLKSTIVGAKNIVHHCHISSKVLAGVEHLFDVLHYAISENEPKKEISSLHTLKNSDIIPEISR